MKNATRTSILTFAAGAACTASIALLIASGPDHKDHQHPELTDTVTQPEMDAMMEMSADMMAAMARLATPDEHHAKLGKNVGNWIAKTSFVMDPASPPTEGAGTMSVKWVLGGRYIMSEFKMDFMGQPFEGIGFNGYDIAHEQYISTWADTMSTKITMMTGSMDDNGTTTLLGTATTPMGDNPMKIVSTWTGNDTMTDKFYDKMPDGSWYSSGSITYTRVID